MKSKIKIFLTVLLAASTTLALQAQRGKTQVTPEQRAEKQTEMMTKQLELSEKQAAEIKEINLKYAEKQQAMREESAKGREKNRTAMQQLQDERKAEINTVLNKDQQQKLEKLQAERPQGRPGKMDRSPRAGHDPDPDKRAEKMTQRMRDQLNLSDDQTARLKDINLDFAKKMQAQREQNKDGQQPDKTAMKKLKDDHRAALKQVLNEEQFKQWEQTTDRRKHDRKGKMKQGTKGM